MIDEKKLIKYIKAEINPYGKPFNDTAYEFGLKLIDYIEAMEKHPQVGGVEIDKNFETLLLCAVRYAIGRRTYIPSLVIDYITPLLSHLSYNTLGLIAAEIIDHSYDGGLGDDMIDRPYWLAFKKKILAEMERRGNETNNTEKAE